MPEHSTPLIPEIRNRFMHVDNCPFQGPRIFFENAGGALTLKSVVETSATFAALPDNQGRNNPAAKTLVDIIQKSKSEMAVWFGTDRGQFFVGESGTELSFRMIRTAVMGCKAKGSIIGSTVEHPASRSAAQHWAEQAGKTYISVPHDNETGQVSAAAYSAMMTPDVQVATILHTSPVTGIANDVPAIAAAIRNIAPDAYIFVDGIQHASHGQIDIASYDIDAYVISPYKVFSRHGYGIAWVSDRLTALGIETLKDSPKGNWEMGTRDTGAYATFRDVMAYFDWLGSVCGAGEDPKTRLQAAGHFIHQHEKKLTDMMLFGAENLPGLAHLPGVTILGGTDNPNREGLVCFALDHVPADKIVDALNDQGIRTHIRKADHYSGNILTPLGLNAAVRVSLCHYNTETEVRALLTAMQGIVAAQ